MTNDLHERLERARGQAPTPRFDLEALDARRDRRATHRRIEALVVGLAILVVLVAGAFAWQRPAARTLSDGGDLGPMRGWSAPPELSFPAHGYHYERRIVVEIRPAHDGQPAAVVSVTDENNPVGQSWYGVDDSGRVRQHGIDESYPAGSFPSDTGDLSGLSTDPSALLDQLVQRTGPDGASPEPYTDWTLGAEAPITAGIVRAAGELLNDANVTPALRAGLAQVIAGLEGAAVQRSHDPFGRPAFEVSIETEQTEHRWWFDRDTLQLLAAAGDPQGTTTSWVLAVEASGFVNTTQSTRPKHPLIPELTIDTDTPVSLMA